MLLLIFNGLPEQANSRRQGLFRVAELRALQTASPRAEVRENPEPLRVKGKIDHEL